MARLNKSGHHHGWDKEYVIGIEEYVKSSQPELMAIIKSNKNFIEKFLYGSLSERLIYHAEIPILVIPHKLR